MNIMKSLKILLVGDTRVNTLIREKDQSRFDIKICPVEGGQYSHIIRETNEQLVKEYFNFLIIVTLQNDMTILKGIGLKKDIYMRLNKEFDIDSLMKMICDEDTKWHEKYPDLHVVWVIPAVPNFIRYNECLTGKRVITCDILLPLNEEQRLYEQYTEKLVEKFRENKLAYIDMNKLTRFRGKRRLEEKANRENPMGRTWIDPVMTIDGLHPQTRMAERFLRMLSQLIKSIMKRRKETLKAELFENSKRIAHIPLHYGTVPETTYPLPDSNVTTNRDDNYYYSSEISKLRDAHLLEWEPYRINPQLHPDYSSAKSAWQKDTRSQGIIFKKFSKMETHWWNFWLQKIKVMYSNSWEEKLAQHYAGKSTHSHRLSRSVSLSSISSGAFGDSDSELINDKNLKRKMLKSVKNSISKKETKSRKIVNESTSKLKELRSSRSSSLSSISSDSFESDSEIREKTKLKKKIKENSQSNKTTTKRQRLRKNLSRYRSSSLSPISSDSCDLDLETKGQCVNLKIDSKVSMSGDYNFSDRSSLELDSVNSFVSNSYKKEEKKCISKNRRRNARKGKRIEKLSSSRCLTLVHDEKLDDWVLGSSKSDETVKKKKDLDGSRLRVLTNQNKTLLDLISSLCKICDQLGAFGVPLSVLHVKAQEYMKNGLSPLECIDEDAKLLFEFIDDKIKKMLQEDDNLPNKRLVLEADKKLTPFLESFQNEESGYELGIGAYYGLEISSLIKATRGMHKTEVIAFVKTFLSYKGYCDVSDIYLNRIYLEIKHHEIEIK